MEKLYKKNKKHKQVKEMVEHDWNPMACNNKA